MGKECGAWVSRRLWGGGNTSPLKTTAWEARGTQVSLKNTSVSLKSTPVSLNSTPVSLNSFPVSVTVSIYIGGCSYLARLPRMPRMPRWLVDCTSPLRLSDHLAVDWARA